MLAAVCSQSVFLRTYMSETEGPHLLCWWHWWRCTKRDKQWLCSLAIMLIKHSLAKFSLKKFKTLPKWKHPPHAKKKFLLSFFLFSLLCAIVTIKNIINEIVNSIFLRYIWKERPPAKWICQNNFVWGRSRFSLFRLFIALCSGSLTTYSLHQQI